MKPPLLGTIYFGSWNKKVYAVDAFGNAKWEYETDGAISASPLLLTKNEETHIYIGSGDGVMCVVLKSVESFENITHPFISFNNSRAYCAHNTQSTHNT